MTVEPDVHVSTRQLDHQAIEALLAKHHVGSTAIAFHDRVNIALANYVYTDRHIYGRLEDGPDVATVRHRHWVAFQVSEIAGIYYWRTVTANGSIPGLTDGPSVGEATEYRKALDLIRGVVPAVFTPRDPMPQRVHLFRMYVDDLTGREARTDARARLPTG
jgi:nitroimidazol reductase NimA-like FMN-containing flavoprotein (pyridoxamine 5'-phosphate oxidase superfamily)